MRFSTCLPVALTVIAIGTFVHAPVAGAAPAIRIVAAERVWADLAEQVAGPEVATTAILSSPTIDPHLFEASPAALRAVAGARIAIANGNDYDPWMDGLLSAHDDPARIVITVAALLPPDDTTDPHLWLDPRYAHALVDRIAFDLEQLSGGNEARSARLKAVQAALSALDGRIAALRAKLGGQAVAATEPLANRLLLRLGLTVRDIAFQHALQNDTEPGPRDVARFEADLRHHRVALMIDNQQVSTPATERLCAIALKAGVPVVSVSESLPPGVHYQDWIGTILDAIANALAAHHD